MKTNYGNFLRALTVTAVFLIAFCAADSQAKGKDSSLAEKIANVESANREWKDISADFTQKTEVKILEKTVSKEGSLYLKKGGKLRIAYSGKGEKTYISDGSTLWIFTAGEKGSLQTYPASDKNIPKEALSFLGEFGSLQKTYTISESSKLSAKDGQSALHLIPKTANPHYSSLDALFSAEGLLVELKVENTSGNLSHYTFRNVKRDQEVPDSKFTLAEDER